MGPTDKYSPGRTLYLGQVNDALPDLAQTPIKHRSRNNQLLSASFNQIEDRFFLLSSGIEKSRIAVIIGSSTSGISDEEEVFPYALEHKKFPDSFDLAQRLFCSPATFLSRKTWDYLVQRTESQLLAPLAQRQSLVGLGC